MKYSNIEFHENPSSGSRVVPCGQTDGRTDGQTDTPRLIVAFRNFANAPKSDEAGDTIKSDKFMTNLASSSFSKSNPCNGVSSSV